MEKRIINHKWENDICLKCGTQRRRVTIKQRMAIVGSRDYYKYTTGYQYIVSTGHGFDYYNSRFNCGSIYVIARALMK